MLSSLKHILFTLFFVFTALLYVQAQDSPPPGYCGIKGKILKILPVKKQAAFPCNKFNCEAKVRILSTTGYGTGFLRPLTIGEVISVTFAFSLNKVDSTKIKGLKFALPGLKKGQLFNSLVQATAGLVNQPETFVIYQYQPVKK